MMAESFVPDQFVNVQLVLAGMVPGKVVAHPVHHQFAEILRIGVPQTDGAMERRLDARRVEIVEDVTVSLVIRLVGVVRVEHGVSQSAGRAHHGHCAVFKPENLS